MNDFQLTFVTNKPMEQYIVRQLHLEDYDKTELSSLL